VADARTRTTSWRDPHEVVAALAELDGLDVLERTRAGELPHPPIAETFGMRLVEGTPQTTPTLTIPVGR